MSETAAPNPAVSTPTEAPAAGGVPAVAGDASGDIASQWQTLMQAYGGAAGGKGGTPGNAFMGTLPLMAPNMAFQPFMYPAPLFYGGVPALHPAYTALAVGAEGAEAKAAAGEGEGGSQQDEHSEEEGNEGEGKDGESKKKGSDSKATSSALGKRKSEPGMGVKSQSSAALSLLASAAANKPGQTAAGTAAATAAAAAAAAAAVAAHQNISDLWGTLNGQPVVSAPDLTRMASDAQMQQLLASGNLDEREAKRLRRKQSNRESARRSRLRKQAECEALARQVKELIQENSRLKEEKLQLGAQIEILTHKLSMTSALHMSINQGELDKIQADLRARQTQEAANLAAQMAQVNAITNGTASLGTLGGKTTEGDDDQDSEATDGNQE